VRRLLGVSAFLFGLSLAGCSGQQQEEEGLEVSGQENQENSEGQEAEGNAEEGNAEGNEENSNEGNEGNEELNNENSEDSADAGDATENDLQEIIQEMNGQQTADTGDTGDATALEQDTAMAGNTGAAGNAMATPATDSAPVDTGATAAASNPPPFQPGGSPAAPGLPEVGSKMAYIVEAGDTLGKISQKIYGSPGRWNELATLSGIANPSRIYPGDLVYYTLDESAVSFATAYESIQRATENVQQGDTLATIATRLYGSSKAWRSIWRHNDKIDNPDVLTVSTVYYVPKGASTAAVNKLKANIAKVSKESLKASKKVAKSVAKKAKSVKVSMVSFDLNSSIASVSNVFGNGFCAAI
jgi:nucleoid-associated protein YgaU